MCQNEDGTTAKFETFDLAVEHVARHCFTTASVAQTIIFPLCDDDMKHEGSGSIVGSNEVYYNSTLSMAYQTHVISETDHTGTRMRKTL